MKYVVKITWVDYSSTGGDEFTIDDSERTNLLFCDGSKPLTLKTETGTFRILDPKAQIKRFFIKPSQEAQPNPAIAPKKEEITLPENIEGLPEDKEPPAKAVEMKPAVPVGYVTDLKNNWKTSPELEKIRILIKTSKPTEAYKRLVDQDILPYRDLYPETYRYLLTEAASKADFPTTARINFDELKFILKTTKTAIYPMGLLENLVLAAEARAKVKVESVLNRGK